MSDDKECSNPWDDYIMQTPGWVCEDCGDVVTFDKDPTEAFKAHSASCDRKIANKVEIEAKDFFGMYHKIMEKIKKEGAFYASPEDVFEMSICENLVSRGILVEYEACKGFRCFKCRS